MNIDKEMIILMIIIEVGATYFKFPCDNKGNIPNTSFHVGSYLKRLTQYQFSPKIKRWIPSFRYAKYDKKKKKLILPKHAMSILTDSLDRANVKYKFKTIRPFKSVPVDIPLNPDFVDRAGQSASIKYLTSQDTTMRGLAANTGCIAEGVRISFNRASNGFTLPIEKAYKKFNGITENTFPAQGRLWDRDIITYVRSYTGEKIKLNPIIGILHSGKKDVYRVTLQNGQYTECTIDHELMTDAGRLSVYDITNEKVMCDQLSVDKRIGKKKGGTYRSSRGITNYSEINHIEYIGKKETYNIQCVTPHDNYVANGIVTFNSGKTFCAIKSMSKLGKKSLILVKGLLEQWHDDLLNITQLEKDDIYVIQGIKSIQRLFTNEELLTKPKVYLASLATIRKYILSRNKPPYNQYPPFDKLIKVLGIGTKITDEVHLNFQTNVIVDLHVNVRNNIYLSATYDRSDSIGSKIFNLVFPPEMRHGEGIFKRYVNITGYNYNIGFVPPGAVRTPQGYSHSLYERYMLKHKTMFSSYMDRVLCPAIASHYLNVKNNNEKMLILVSTKKMATAIRDYLSKRYVSKNFKIATYLFDDGDDVLVDSDIIVSTPGSAGTGTDIKNLRTTILTISFKSDVLTKQTLGRLRELDGVTPEFVYLYTNQIESHMYHAKQRSYIYNQRAKNFTELTL